MDPMLNTAIRAARRAASIINRASLDLERVQIGRKGPRDYVTEVDAAVEQSSIESLSTAYPDHAFLGEEGGAVPSAQGELEADYIWVIDPLDGTTNFIHGVPHFSISIACLIMQFPLRYCTKAFLPLRLFLTLPATIYFVLPVVRALF